MAWQARGLRRTLAAMSDDDDTPRAATAAVPEAGKGWSEQDRRMLIITFGGGLAANLAAVILVGAALAFVHAYRSAHALSALLWYSLAAFVIGPGLLFTSRYLYSRRGWWRDREYAAPDPFIQRLAIVVSCVVLLEAALVLTGLAAGVK